MRSARLAVGAVAVEGTYRDVGPRLRHPLHALPVPAWITLGTVSRVGAKSFKVRVTTARAGGCDGAVTAGGLLLGKSMTAVADGAECKLAIEFRGQGDGHARARELQVVPGPSVLLRRQPRSVRSCITDEGSAVAGRPAAKARSVSSTVRLRRWRAGSARVMRLPLFRPGEFRPRLTRSRKKPRLLRRGARFPRAWEVPPERKSTGTL